MPPDFMHKYSRVFRYLTSGGITALVLFISLIIFREVLGFWYLLASVLSFCLSVVTSFSLQRFWTFRDNEDKNTHKQFLFFVAVSVCNLAINTSLMYVAVSIFDIQYLIAQFIVTGLIAFITFFVYRDIIFRHKL